MEQGPAAQASPQPRQSRRKKRKFGSRFSKAVKKVARSGVARSVAGELLNHASSRITGAGDMMMSAGGGFYQDEE